MPFKRAEGDWWSEDATSRNLTALPCDGVPELRGGRAWAQLLGSVAALGGLAGVLPAPWMAAALVQASRVGQTGGPAGADVGDAAMLLGASAAVWLLLLWAFVAAGAALMGRFPGAVGRHGRTVLAKVAPAAARRVLLVAVGASMVTGVAACGADPASTMPAGPGSPSAGSAGIARVDDNLVDDSLVDDSPVDGHSVTAGRAASWTTVAGSAVHLRPAAVVVAPAPTGPVDIDWPAARAATSRTTTAGSVVVLRGDSLWSIAARHLPRAATPADIDRAWHQWFSANAAVIGTDPNLILPGQILLPPNPGTDS